MTSKRWEGNAEGMSEVLDVQRLVKGVTSI